jgi:DNA polymerase III alpha subunit
MPDIDIDFADRTLALRLFQHIRASRNDNGSPVAHNTGVYLHAVPVHAPSNLCAVSYDQAEELDFFKIDFLNVSIYKDIKDEEHLTYLMNQEPLWDLLEQDEFVNLLFHVNGHGDLLRKLKPTNIEQLAAVLAIIRPAKRYLANKSWNEILNEVWDKPRHAHEYYFKRSHATAYAAAIVVQMNLICEKISIGFS